MGERGILALDLATKVESVVSQLRPISRAAARSVGANDAAESQFIHRYISLSHRVRRSIRFKGNTLALDFL